MDGASASVTSKTQCVKKVSKPLMEKKRRARINKCLNQLKSLLESVSSNNIRKRKLEKADILELTVKHLRYLQNTERGMANVCDSAEYHAGYRTCLASVSRYLLASDTDRDSRSIMITRLTSAPARAGAPDFSPGESDATLPFAPAGSLTRSNTASVQANAPYPNLQQSSDRNYCFMPKRTEICDMSTISLDAQVEAAGSLKLKTNPKAGECCSLKQNYWRPW